MDRTAPRYQQNPEHPECAGRCGKRVANGGLCRNCYQKKWRANKSRPLCIIEGCTNNTLARGLCNPHYKQAGATGTLQQYKMPRADFGTGCITQGYRRVGHNGYQVQEQRVVMEKVLGRPLTKGEEVHHLNGDKLDNRPENLELWRVGKQPAGQRVNDLIAYLEECGLKVSARTTQGRAMMKELARERETSDSNCGREGEAR